MDLNVRFAFFDRFAEFCIKIFEIKNFLFDRKFDNRLLFYATI